MTRTPDGRGDLSTALGVLLTRDPARTAVDLPDPADALDGLQALWVVQELHYRGFDGVDDAWEWHPDLLRLRVELEAELEQRLRQRWSERPGHDRAAPTDTAGVVAELERLVADDDGPSLGRHLQRHGSREQALDLMRQRSVYHLKEADPTAWVLPRLTARTKAALAEVQYDEYGAGDPTRLHHHLFERGMAATGLDASYGAYVGDALAEVLEQNVALTMFGLHRRLRGAALGHFAAFEATSSVPSAGLARALRGLGLADELAAYYDEHVEADAVHEQLALRGICGVLVEQEPELAADVLFGAWTCLDLEARVGHAMLARWDAA